MNDRDYLNLLINELVNKKSMWGEASGWTDYQFNLLSEEIENETKICVSTTTLKRIFGKRKYSEQYNPQVETKNALSKFLDYKDWFDFKVDIKDTVIDKPKKQKRNTDKSNGITFSISDTVGLPPLCPKINYNISSKSSKYSIKFTDGQSRDLDPAYNFITHPYEIPGYYNPRVFENENIIGSKEVHVISEGWVPGICYKKWNFTQIIEDTVLDDGTVPFVRISDIKAYDGRKNFYWIQYRNFFVSDTDGDNFKIKTKVKNNYRERGIPYFDIIITLVGEGGKIETFFIDKNQHYWIESYFSEIKLNGEFNDLSTFVRDLSDWCEIEVENTNKNVQIRFNEEEIFSIQYKKSIGTIKGCILTFRGFGSCNYFHLYDKSGDLIIKDNIKTI